MRHTMGALSAIAILLSFSDSANAQINERHQRLMSMTVKAITEGGASDIFDDRDAVGHVLLRCSIIFSAIGEVLTATTPQNATSELRDDIDRIRNGYNSISQAFALDGASILEMPEESFLALYNGMFSEWSATLLQAGVQMFSNNEPNGDGERVSRAFNDEIDICNQIAQQ